MKQFIYWSMFFLLLISSSLYAQDDAPKKDPPRFKFSGGTSLNFSESSFTNWAAGGENSLAGNIGANLKLLYKKEKVSWESDLILGYGLTFIKRDKRKNDDKIDFASKLGYKAFGSWDYTFLTSFKTQFDRGYAAYPVTDSKNYNSKFMAPAYLMLSIGMDYKPNENFSMLISPISGKFTFVNDTLLSNKGAFGVHPGDKQYYEFGAYVKTVFSKKIQENILLRSSLDFFSNLLKSPENVDINWEVVLDLKVTKFISTKFTSNLVYDDDVKTKNDEGLELGPKVQFKHVLGVGFSYIF